LESPEIATYCADAENCGSYLWPLRARELFRVGNETRALRSETRRNSVVGDAAAFEISLDDDQSGTTLP
jgi:hypothetical protein